MILILLMPVLLQLNPPAGGAASDFVLDHSKPYVYLAFDHIGPRKPVLEGEDTDGLWLRIVNNCRVPVSIGTYGSAKDAGLGVFYEVIPVDQPMIVAGPNIGEAESEKNKGDIMPSGYPGAELSSPTIIPSGKSLVVNVPRRTVGPKWFLRIKFELRVNHSPASPGPFTELDFFNEEIPFTPHAKP